MLVHHEDLGESLCTGIIPVLHPLDYASVNSAAHCLLNKERNHPLQTAVFIFFFVTYVHSVSIDGYARNSKRWWLLILLSSRQIDGEYILSVKSSMHDSCASTALEKRHYPINQSCSAHLSSYTVTGTHIISWPQYTVIANTIVTLWPQFTSIANTIITLSTYVERNSRWVVKRWHQKIPSMLSTSQNNLEWIIREPHLKHILTCMRYRIWHHIFAEYQKIIQWIHIPRGMNESEPGDFRDFFVIHWLSC